MDPQIAHGDTPHPATPLASVACVFSIDLRFIFQLSPSVVISDLSAGQVGNGAVSVWRFAIDPRCDFDDSNVFELFVGRKFWRQFIMSAVYKDGDEKYSRVLRLCCSNYTRDLSLFVI